MKERIITLTSKNQITLPVEYVRKFDIGRSRRLIARWRGGALILKPEPSIDEVLAPLWAKMAKHIKRPLTDEELNNAAREAYATHRRERS